MNNKVLKDLVARLRIMESGDTSTLGNFNTQFGICNNLDMDSYNNARVIESMTNMYYDWSEFSGYNAYPVGNGVDDYFITKDGEFISNWLNNNYCNSRRRLAGHLANEFEKMLNDCIDMSEDAVLNRGYF